MSSSETVQTLACEYEIGSRIRDQDGYRATVRYIGPVASAKDKSAIWLGVEWDNKSRGKHDGSCVDDLGVLHRYFECSPGSGQTAGSFMKPGKAAAVPRTRLLQALRARYVAEDAPQIVEQSDGDADGAPLPDAFVSTSSGKLKSIQFYGEKKIRKWQQISGIQKIALRNENIHRIADEGDTDGRDVAQVLGHVTEVDLQDNLLWQWREVGELGRLLPRLSALLLHGNRMQPLSEDIGTTAFAPLRLLALNHCNLTSWAEMQRLEPHLPLLEELYLAGNYLPDLPRLQAEMAYREATGIVVELKNIVSGFAQLQLLDLAGCGLDEWSQVGAFGCLPALKELRIDENQIQSVLPPPASVDTLASPHFPSLQRLSASALPLASWSDIDALDRHSTVRGLRLNNLPLFAGKGASEVRPLVIARISHLEFFNGSVVTYRERQDAERAYLRAIAREHPDPSSTPSSAVHPRYAELMEKYGQDLLPASGVFSKVGSTLSSELVSVTLCNLTFSSGGSLQPVAKKLPATLTVLKLKMIVKQIFGLDPALQQLSIRLYKDSPPTLLEDDLTSLNYYGAMDGAEIFINEAKATAT